jgi:hypothetical protein
MDQVAIVPAQEDLGHGRTVTKRVSRDNASYRVSAVDFPNLTDNPARSSLCERSE